MTHHRLKGIVFILDGLGDRPCTELDRCTPLEYADTPYLDKLARLNQCGLMDPVLPGLPVDTHTGVGILFGLSPHDATHLSRGPIEAAGIDLKPQWGDLLFRANLATVEKDGDHYRILDRRADRIRDGVIELCQALQELKVGDNLFASLFPATQHRCVLRMRGPRLSAEISDTDPTGKAVHKGILQARSRNSKDENSQKTADAVNEFTRLSHHILSRHPLNLQRIHQGENPANGVLTRGVGAYRDFSSTLSYLRIKAAVIAGESTILGLARLCGFTALSDPSFTALPNTDLRKKLDFAHSALKTHDLVYVHIKATDTTAHDRDPAAKARFISHFDSVLEQSDMEAHVIAVCADHSTDSLYGEHSGDPVPVLLHNPVGRQDLADQFGEKTCSMGALGRLNGQGFLLSTLDAMGCLPNLKPSDMTVYRPNG
ncbi:MAG: 2,3-bisphosphoglycerate-independent phosphoglycerate mutase [Gammaproteobacteria bacterium]|nr:2,3-bisphosphoglycerate-independent phosphoglycerate mutase [Gammaproteobacteria bacterium]